MKEHINAWTEQITPWMLNHGIKVLLFAIAAFILNKVICHFIDRTVRMAVLSSSHIDQEAERKREDTLIAIFSATIKIAIITVTSLMILQEFGVMIGPILAAAGILGLAFGFGGQYLIRDIISGLFIILENQYRIGDVVSFDLASGTVEEISLRKTTLRDLNGTVHHIPHGEIKKVSNMTSDYSRINLDMGVGYSTNLEHVIRVINETCNELAEDPNIKEAIIKTPQFLRVQDFADSAMILKIIGETQAGRQFEITGELRKRLKIAFDKEGIEIPFPQMVIHQAKIIE
jgi:moderate conductance mechanosensitive channel